MTSEQYGLFLDFFHNFDSNNEFYYKEILEFNEKLLREYAMFWYKDNWEEEGASTVYQICITDYNLTNRQRLYIAGHIHKSYKNKTYRLEITSNACSS